MISKIGCVRFAIVTAGTTIILMGCRTSPRGNSASMAGPGWPEETRILPQAVAPKEWPQVPPPDGAAAEVPQGYQVEVLLKDLTYPSSIAFDEGGNLFVAEAGYSYGDPVAPARILRVNRDGKMEYIAHQFNGPISGLTWHQGRLYVSHFGKISVVEKDGNVHDIVRDIPLSPAHPNSEVAVGRDGKLYFAVGSLSNSGVVGLDEASPFLGLLFWPDLHDVPPVDLRLTGVSYPTPEPMNVMAKQGKLTSNGRIFSDFVSSLFNKGKHRTLLARTGPFQPFGQNAHEVKAEKIGSTAVYRMNADGSGLELYAWGLRSPFGFRFGPDGELYCSDNGPDERGSRPIANAKDDIWLIRKGGWYGFPDFSSGIPLTDPRFVSSRGPKPQSLLRDHPPVERPLFSRPPHSGVAKFDFSTNRDFGFERNMFLAEVGSGAPINAPGTVPAGFQVVRVDLGTGRTEPFFKAKTSALGPEPYKHVVTAGPRRPVDVRFSPDGSALYVVDFGPIAAFPAGVGPLVHPFPGAGVVWRITREGSSPQIPSGLSPLVQSERSASGAPQRSSESQAGKSESKQP
ncbi:MAG TPA: PQQ-dependent sugar dehydrogenase [Verrucomicrobiae bacterium]|nr:PQQ-dependent sugar dehydrogenase [Verrucomicrobiae bacterium]